MNAMSKYQTIHHSHRASAGCSHAVRRSVLMILVSVILSTGAFAQGVGISESAITPDASAILELRSTTRGFLMPRNSATLGFSVQGLSFYNTTSNRLNYHNGSTWLEVPAKADNLSVFASTTSAQLLGLLSDETGTGLAVFATSPTLVTPNIGVATATSVNKVAITTPATGSTLTIADGKTLTASNTLTFTGTDGSTLNIGAGGTLGSNAFSSSAFAPLVSPTFTGTVTVPTPFTLGATSVTTTGAELNFVSGVTSAIQTQINSKQGTLTNSAGLAGALSDETGTGAAVFANTPTFVTPVLGAATGTSLSLGGGTALTTTNRTGTGNLVLATSPTLTTPVLGVATATSVNGLSLTANATGFSIAGGTVSKTLTASNSLTFAGTDGSTLNIGAGGTLGSNAYTSTSFAPLASPTFTGTVTVPTPFTLGATSVTATGAELNFVSGVTSAIQTQINSKQGTLTNSAGLAGALSDETGSGLAVFATSPTLTTPTIGVATATSVNKVAITAPATGSTLTIADGKTLTASNSLTLAGTDGTTLNIGAGGTLGSNAYTSTSFAPLASPTFTGTVTVPTPFTLGATSVTATGAELNFVSGVTSAIQTQLNAKQGTLSNSAGLAGALSDETGSGLAVFATSPTLTTPVLGVATATSVNGLSLTANATGFSIAGGTVSKTLTASNTLTFAGTDGSTLNIGAGGTLGTNAFSSTSFAPLASPTFTGTVTIPTPFTLGATSVTTTGAELNFVSGVTSAIQTQINSKQGTLTNSAGLAGALSDETGTGAAVFANTPTFVTPVLGAATGTSLSLGGGTALTTTNRTGTGNLVLATSPTLTTPVLGVATATSLNGLSLTANATGFSIAGGTVSKTLTASNSLTFAGTDGSTLNIGAGGTLGSNAYTSTSFAPLASPTFTGTVTVPTPFTLGATSVTATGAELNFVSGVTSAIQTQINAKQGTLTNSAGLAGALSDETGTGLAVFATSPALTTPDIGAATGTSLALGGGTALTTTNRTGTGNLVLATSPTLVTPVLGVATGTSLALGGGTALTTTNQTGTGNLVLANTPTLVTPVLGVATGTSLALGGGTALTTTNQTGTGNLVLANTPTLVTPNIGAATGTSLSVTGALTAQAATNQLVLGTTNTTTLSATAPAASRTYTLPDFGANGVIPIGTAGNSIALTTTGATNVTLPTSGTLATIGVLANIQVLQNPTVTYTPTAGARTAIVYLLGGGGGGGAGGSAATANRIGPGSGGGSGSLVVLEIPDLSIAGSYTIAVGTGGASATAGVATTFIYNGVTTTAPGGGAGNVGTTTNGAFMSIGGAGGAVGTNGTVNGFGANGQPGIGASATVGISGNGADSHFGRGGLGRKTHGIGNAATGYGSGGGGGLQLTTNVVVAGGAGSNGVIIVYEFK